MIYILYNYLFIYIYMYSLCFVQTSVTHFTTSDVLIFSVATLGEAFPSWGSMENCVTSWEQKCLVYMVYIWETNINYGKSPFLMGKSTINGEIIH
jgi:hypothetical protein